MLKVIICDDVLEFQQELRKLIEKIAIELGEMIQIESYMNGNYAL